MLAQISGRSSFLLSTLPRSPPVHVATSTSTPSATYFAMVAAPLLDSSSGCACTANSRSCCSTAGPPPLHRQKLRIGSAHRPVRAAPLPQWASAGRSILADATDKKYAAPAPTAAKGRQP
jgi:hypothetical protein